jgi:hypothetical protein
MRRLAPLIGGTAPAKPELRASGIAYEFAERCRAIPCGGVGAIMRLAEDVGLVHALNEQLGILKVARPYQDSDRDARRAADKSFVVRCGRLEQES